MFKYIDNKTERFVEATIKSLATKDDLAKVNNDLGVRISETKADMIKWMFIFWIGQVGVMLGIVLLYFKK